MTTASPVAGKPSDTIHVGYGYVLAADLIRSARQYAGLSQSELARRANVTQQQVSRYEAGEVQPAVATLQRIVEACDLDMTIHLEPTAQSKGKTILDIRRLGLAERRGRQSAEHVARPTRRIRRTG